MGLILDGTTGISASGNITGGNITVTNNFIPASVDTTGNVTGGNVLTSGLISATGNITGGNVSGTLLTGTLATAAQPNVTSLGLLTSMSVAGFTFTGNTIVSSGATLTIDPNTVGGVDGVVVINGNLQVNGNTTTVNSNTIAINDLVFVVANNASTASQADGAGLAVGPDPSHYAELSYSQSANVWTTSIGLSVAGVVKTAANITGGNLLTSGLISSTGAVTASQFNGSGAGLTSIPGANVTGTLSVNTTGYAATVTTNAQPNITSVGTLSSLTVTANVSGGNILTAGLVSAGGTITSAANISGSNFLTGGLVSATGQVTGSQFNGSGAGLTSIPAANVTGTLSVNTTGYAATVSTNAQPNITSVGTLSSLTVTANIGGGNILTGGLVSATGTVTGSQFNGSGAGLTSIPAANVTGTLSVNTTGYAATVSTAAQPNITSVGTLSSLAVTANVTGGNLLTGGLVSAAGAITGAAITGTSLTVSTGNISGGNINNNNANGVGNIGSSTTYFNTVFAKATSAQYADLAEMYAADAHYAPGTVIEFSGTHEVTTSSTSHSTRVAGIVSTNPSYLMNSTLSSDYPVQVALVGRVPCRVVGTIAKGDRMVSSNLPGVATALDTNFYAPGCIIGKALEDYNSDAEGVIEVAVGRT